MTLECQSLAVRKTFGAAVEKKRGTRRQSKPWHCQLKPTPKNSIPGVSTPHDIHTNLTEKSHSKKTKSGTTQILTC